MYRLGPKGGGYVFRVIPRNGALCRETVLYGVISFVCSVMFRYSVIALLIGQFLRSLGSFWEVWEA